MIGLYNILHNGDIIESWQMKKQQLPCYIQYTCTLLPTVHMYLATYSTHVPCYLQYTCTLLHTVHMYPATYSTHVPCYIQ